MRRTLLPLMLGLAVASPVLSVAQNASLNSQYAKLKKAYWRTDARSALSVFGTNFTWVKPMGEVVRYPEFANNLRRLFDAPGIRFRVVDMKNDSVNVNGDEAWVRSHKTLKYQQRIDGRIVTSNIAMETVDTWRRSPSGWKLFKVQVVNQTERNDGS